MSFQYSKASIKWLSIIRGPSSRVLVTQCINDKSITERGLKLKSLNNIRAKIRELISWKVI